MDYLEQDGPPMDVGPLYLSEETVTQALEEVKTTLQTMFGNYAENREIGITGDVQERSRART